MLSNLFDLASWHTPESTPAVHMDPANNFQYIEYLGPPVKFSDTVNNFIPTKNHSLNKITPLLSAFIKHAHIDDETTTARSIWSIRLDPFDTIQQVANSLITVYG